jgi:hypothetical protein
MCAVNVLKVKKVKVDHADRTPRETLEKRLEEMPSNARCFAKGSSVMYRPILESLMVMGTARGANELGLGPHGLSCQAGARGHYIGFCLGYCQIWKIQYWEGRQKYSARPITFAHDEFLKPHTG